MIRVTGRMLMSASIGIGDGVTDDFKKNNGMHYSHLKDV